MDEAAEGVRKLVASVSLPLNNFVDFLNASTEQAHSLLSSTDSWLGELEDGMLVRLNAFDSAHRWE